MPQTPRAILVAAACRTHDQGAPVLDVEQSLEELGRLAETGGFRPLRSVVQRRKSADRLHYLGRGKAEELGAWAKENDCGLLICDDELSGLEARNLEEASGLAVLDRTQLILRIFASRAHSGEGKLQVELAELLYRLPRLAGSRDDLSRLGGGIGTRGPGETKLEVDRRTIRSRIADLEREIEGLRTHRKLHRHGRRRMSLPVLALVGYTNAGKSTLLNSLTGSQVLVEDRLFATLDPTTRSLLVPGGGRVLVTDTVGFIHKLPHALVAAFRATLEEVGEADLLLHVVDASHPLAAEQAAIVSQVLGETGAGKTPAIVVLNKIDLLGLDGGLARLLHEFPAAVPLSALSGEGLPGLLEAVAYHLRGRREELRAIIPYDRGELLSLLHEQGGVESEVFGGAGVEVRATVDRSLARRIRDELERSARR